MLTSLYGYFCYKANTFVEIPLDVWAVGLICAGPQAVELLRQIKGGFSEKNNDNTV